MKNKIIRNILLFTFFVFLSGWIGYYIDRSLPPQPDEKTPGMALWLILPLLTTFLLRAFAGDGWKDIGLKPGPLANAKWYFVSFAIFPLVTAVGLLSGKALGWIDFSRFRTGDYLSVFAASLLPNFIKNIFEEFVWRGYLTTKLLRLQLRDRWIYLIVGAVWGVWHIPYYLFFLPESQISQILPVERGVFAFVAIITMVCWTVLYVELYRITRSIWPVVILHMAENSVIDHLVIDKHVAIAAGKEFLVSPVAGILPTVLYLLAGLALRKIRKRKAVTGKRPPATQSVRRRPETAPL